MSRWWGCSSLMPMMEEMRKGGGLRGVEEFVMAAVPSASAAAADEATG